MPVIGVVPKGTNHTFWQSVHAGAIKAGQEFGLDIEWNAPQMEIDAARQIAIVENFITVTKTATLDWPELLDEIEAAILRALDSLR